VGGLLDRLVGRSSLDPSSTVMRGQSLGTRSPDAVRYNLKPEVDMPNLPSYVRHDVLMLLVLHAQNERTVNYGPIMRACGIPRGRAESIVGSISKWTFRQWGVYLSSIVVHEDTGYPGDGFFELPGMPLRFRRESDRWADQALSAQAKAFVDECQKEVFAWATGCSFSITMPAAKRTTDISVMES